MQRNEKQTVRDLLRHAHESRAEWTPTPAWRQSVMGEVARTTRPTILSEFERLAPRIAITAVAASVIFILIGTLSLDTLSNDIYSAYASTYYDVSITGI